MRRIRRFGTADTMTTRPMDSQVNPRHLAKVDRWFAKRPEQYCDNDHLMVTHVQMGRKVVERYEPRCMWCEDAAQEA